MFDSAIQNVFAHIGDDHRIWIYQSNRILSAEEQDKIRVLGNAFCDGWASHGAQLDAQCRVIEGLFIILSVDAQKVAASGCSIDKSVHWISSIESAFNIILMDRMQVAWLSEDGALKNGDMSVFKQEIANGRINKQTHVFDNTLTKGIDLKLRWKVPAENTWLTRYLN